MLTDRMYRHAFAVALLAALLAAGCATPVDSTRPVVVATPDVLGRYTKLLLATSVQGEAARMTQRDRDRIVTLVARKIREQAPGRFTDFGAKGPDSGTLYVVITFTRYEEGNHFARLAAAGLGRIQIDAEVTLADPPSRAVLARSDVTKVFAAGGTEAALAEIRDVEEGFAEAVARVILGEEGR